MITSQTVKDQVACTQAEIQVVSRQLTHIVDLMDHVGQMELADREPLPNEADRAAFARGAAMQTDAVRQRLREAMDMATAGNCTGVITRLRALEELLGIDS